MNWTRRHSFAAGLGLVLLVNAIALAGVAWNRRAPADSQLQLSERELGKGYDYWRQENSGIALHLDYRWPSQAGEQYGSRLTPAQMAELGFAVPRELNDASVRAYRRQLDRDGLLVLEFNGPLYQRELQRARDQLASNNADLAAVPANQQLIESQRAAREALQRETVSASRLFVAAVGLDRQALRARYPDRQRYAILRGQIKAWAWNDGKRWQLGGTADIPVAQRINLPHAWHIRYAHLPLRPADPDFPHAERAKLFNANLAIGQRLEPWLTKFAAPPPSP